MKTQLKIVYYVQQILINSWYVNNVSVGIMVNNVFNVHKIVMFVWIKINVVVA